MRLINADKIDFNKVFIGASEFAKDIRVAAQEVINSQPIAYDVDKVLEQMEEYVKESSNVDYNRAMIDAIEIVKSGSIE